MYNLKFVCLILSLTLIRAEYLYGDPYQHAYAAGYDNYKPRDYKFEYGVSDPHTGDHKSQWEVRENGIVRGSYSLLEPDGTTRIVDYYADDTGFHADVKKIGHAIHEPSYGELHPIVQTDIADSIVYNGYGHGGLSHGYGAPIAAITKVAAPVVSHVAPIAQVEHIAPVQQVIAPQIHHLGTPIHQQEYAPHYDSLPNIYHQHEHQQELSYPVEQIPYNHEYAPIEKIVHGPILQQPSPFKLAIPEHETYFQPQPTPVQFSPEPIAQKYIVPEHYQTPVVPVKIAPAKVENPFMKLFAPFAKYFAPFAKINKVAPSVAPTAYYQPTVINYDGYQHKPEAVLASPHNYAPFDYNDHHAY